MVINRKVLDRILPSGMADYFFGLYFDSWKTV